MTTFHIVLGVAVVVVNLAAGLLGAYKWRKDEYSHAFWPILRTGQALVVIEALDGAVLLLMGQELPRLHLIYGLVPLGVAVHRRAAQGHLGAGDPGPARGVIRARARPGRRGARRA